MAEPLKNQFSIDVAHKISSMVAAVYPQFEQQGFVEHIANGFDQLELMDRARHICEAFNLFLPKSYPKSVAILMKSLGPKLEQTDYFGYTPFLYLPHVFYVGKYGLEHFEASMNAQYELTQRFTAEFSIRPFIERYPEATLTWLKAWAINPSPHVRRLASEGTRPRLPWAPRLRDFQKNPRPVLPILELLKDDPDLYVRRSVANHLNDIGKDNPEILFSLATEWMDKATPERAWIVKHALRSSIKAGDPRAFAVLGFGDNQALKLVDVQLSSTQVALGGQLELTLWVENPSRHSTTWVVDLKVHFVKAKGKTTAKVFKLKNLQLQGGETAVLSKSLSFAPMTTRQFYPGIHRLQLAVNGKLIDLPSFEVLTSELKTRQKA